MAISVSINGRVIIWSDKQKKQLGYFDIEGNITSADINNKHNVLAIGRDDGVVQFYSIASFSNAFIFKEFKLTKGNRIDEIKFSSNS